ncbi:hypothetical protein GNQ08_29625 [Paenibacillus macerans]|uniref:Uncharacterized protein n=1 Tax=Paenibacillus macerans TaxID=44252 RepID=A0A6N8F747_PAEMA|nr:hypothetical protein [Paenibacillus macerans]MUG26491.1 hypothetical protein [Paenibacillus macerans]
MKQDGDYTTAICDKLPVRTLLEVFALIYKAHAMPETQLNYIDPLDNVSYCASFRDQTLAVSVVDYGPLPNASLLPILSDRFGEPDRMLSKPWYRNEECTFFVMYWDGFDIESIINSFSTAPGYWNDRNIKDVLN